MADLAAILEHVLVPLVTAGGGGIAGAILGVRKKIKRLEAKIEAARLAAHEAWIVADRDIQAIRADRSGKARSYEARFAELRRDVTELRDELESVRVEARTFADNDELAAHMKAQQDRWELVQRTLGQIEGTVNAQYGAPTRKR